ALCIGMPVAAFQVPENVGTRAAPLSMLDARINHPGAYESALTARPKAATEGRGAALKQAAEIAEASRALAQAVAGLDLRMSAMTGAPDSISRKGAPLTGPAPGRSSEAIVRDFLHNHRRVFGLSARDLADLVVLGDSPGGRSGLRMLRME